MSEVYKIFCIIPDGSDAFPVKISKNEDVTVEDLKDKIKNKLPIMLNAFDAHALTLYKINVDGSDMEKAKVTVKALAQNPSTLVGLNALLPLSEALAQNPSTLNKLNSLLPLSDVLLSPSGVPAPAPAPALARMKIDILVKVPEVKFKTPPTNWLPDQTLEYTPIKPREELNGEIKRFLDKCRPAMQKLVRNAHNVPSLLPSWKPAPSASQGFAKHISDLRIPKIAGGGPSMLLHALGEEEHDDRIPRVLSSAYHKVLINTTGSGKTRLLLEGLCHRWGFYFVAKRDMSAIGSRDFELFMSQLDNAKDDAGLLGPKAIEHIRQVARVRLAQLLLARFLLLELLVQETRNLQGGLRQKEHRRLWVLLQVQPSLFGSNFEVDAFTDLTQVLRGAEMEVLETRIRRTRLELLQTHNLLETVRNPATVRHPPPPFFCILDEVQATVASPSGRMGEFMSEDNVTHRPILREIWHYWTGVLAHDMRIVLSGTGVEFHDLNAALASHVGKDSGYRAVHDIGAFDSHEAQAQYIKRLVPADWSQPSWDAFLNRAWNWLHGRHRNTATLVSLMLEGGYQCPHRTIDAFVEAFSGFTPTDAKYWTEREPPLPLSLNVKNEVFKLDFEKMSVPQAETLFDVVYSQMLLGHYKLNSFSGQDTDDFVRRGFARHKGHMTVIDEPLAILAARKWLDWTSQVSVVRYLHRHIAKHPPRQNGFKTYLAFYLRHVFKTATALDNVFAFRDDSTQRPDLAWQHEEFELVTVVGLANTTDPQISALTPTSGSSPNVGLRTESDDQVVEWISTNSERYTFCFPSESFGPDLLFFVQSKSGKVILVVIQAKHYKKVEKQTLIEGIRSVTPAWFWKTKDRKYASADTAPFIAKNQGPQFSIQTKDALASIPAGLNLKSAGADYPILRVFASWPGEGRLDRVGDEDPDAHPLASLRLDKFDEVSKQLSRDWFLRGGQQVLALPSKRAREELEWDLRPRKRAKSAEV